MQNKESGRYRGARGSKPTGRTSENWKSNQTAMVDEIPVSGEGGKKAVVEQFEHIDERARSVHGEEENRDAMISSLSKKQLQFLDNGPVNGLGDRLSNSEKRTGGCDPTNVLGGCKHMDSGLQP
ncbi:hypothetical protein Q3G72_009437 [Acer saccharum]|nr:hypothetical protein Q3G72_009437 [Acer saccharum]